MVINRCYNDNDGVDDDTDYINDHNDDNDDVMSRFISQFVE